MPSARQPPRRREEVGPENPHRRGPEIPVGHSPPHTVGHESSRSCRRSRVALVGRPFLETSDVLLCVAPWFVGVAFPWDIQGRG